MRGATIWTPVVNGLHAGKKTWGEGEKKNRLGVKVDGNKLRIIYPKVFRISDVIVQRELHRKPRLIRETSIFIKKAKSNKNSIFLYI